MILAGQSILSLIAAYLYVLVTMSCLSAVVAGVTRGQPSPQIVRWICLAGVFVALFVLRAFGIEEGWRTAMRAALWAEGSYEMRREYQRPVAAIILASAAVAAFVGVYRMAQRPPDRPKLVTDLAGMSALTLLVLLAFRIVSLSPVDRLLYGPTKINWIVDVGGSLAVASLALVYVRYVLVRK